MQWEEWTSPIRKGRWTDATGRKWTRRGKGQVGVKRAYRLLRDPETRVHFLYLWYEDREIPFADRGGFWSQVEPYLTGGNRTTDDMTEYAVAEFKDGEGKRLLLVEKYC
jgi:hypothetical protein